MSDTPRTDKHVADIGADGLADGDFARTLERELAEAKAGLEHLYELHKRERDTLRQQLTGSDKALAAVKDRITASDDFDAEEVVRIIDGHVGRYSQGAEWLASKALQEEVPLTKLQHKPRIFL